jgi:hypothetical protein
VHSPVQTAVLNLKSCGQGLSTGEGRDLRPLVHRCESGESGDGITHVRRSDFTGEGAGGSWVPGLVRFVRDGGKQVWRNSVAVQDRRRTTRAEWPVLNTLLWRG